MLSIGDLMYAFAQWLKTTPLTNLSVWLVDTPLSKLVDSNIWTAPIVQTIHILAIAMTFGSVLMVNLRLVGQAGKSRTMAQTVARYGPWVWWGLLVLLLTGLILIIGEPARELINPNFWTKMFLIVVAGAIALWFQESVRKHGDRWAARPNGTLAIKAASAGVMTIWCLIIFLGRWIAYAAI